MIKLLAGLFIAMPLLLVGQSYFKTYPSEVESVKKFCAKHRQTIDSVFGKYSVSPEVALSIVAPEVGHYSVWQDKMEVSVVSLFYVEMGSDYNNFSIGYFQMKPAFAEQIEGFIKSLALKNYYSLLNYKSQSPRLVRDERVARLQSIAFQSVYLAAFIAICEKRYSSWFTNEPPITYLAAAYNFGFWNSEEKIKAWSKAHNFPSSGKKAFSYSAVAVEYFQASIM